MHTITFFANKGGSGRTVATMALASGFLAQGKRVAVMDCTDLAGCNPNGPFPSTLQNWMQRMAACKFRPPRLELIECRTPEEVEDSGAAADERGIDILLIDTAARIREPQIAALGVADLVIAPAISPFEARCILDGIDEYLGPAILSRLREPCSGPTVVMTHHLPVRQLISPARTIGGHEKRAMTNGFACDLWDEIRAFDIHTWIWGHSHEGQTWRGEGEHGPIHFCTNQRGYPGEGVTFDPAYQIQI